MHKRLGLSVIFAMLLISGCMRNEQTTDAKTLMTVKPVELYNDKNEKFKPFMGTMSGAFKLRYKGAKPNASLDLEIWQKGKAPVPAGSLLDLFFSSDGRKNDEVEVILALEDDPNAKSLRVKLGTFYDSGHSVGTYTIPLEKNLVSRGLLYDHEPRTFAAEEGATVPVWAMHATSSNEIRASSLSLEALKEQEWALVVLFRSTD